MVAQRKRQDKTSSPATSEPQSDNDSAETKPKRRPITSAAVSGSPVIQLGSAGRPLPLITQQPIERSLGADLSDVRVHDDAGANRAVGEQGARAFAYGNHIYLGAGESASNLPLMAHEAAHTIQQQRVPALQMYHGVYGFGQNAYEAEAHRASLAVTTGTYYNVVNRTGGLTVQHLFEIPIPDFIIRYADDVPGFTLATVIIGRNPLTGERVEPTPTNLLRALMGLVPGGNAIYNALQSNEIVQAAFEYVRGELNRFDLSLSRLERVVRAAISEIGLAVHTAFDVIVRHFGAILSDIRDFGRSLFDHLIDLITDAAIDLIEGMLEDEPAWELVKKVIGYDPLRGEEVDAPTVEILEDFIKLTSENDEEAQTRIAQMREQGTLQETADWLETQFAQFRNLLTQLRQLFTQAWEAIQPENLPQLSENIQGLANDAVEFLSDLVSFGTTVSAKVLELVKDALLSWLKSQANNIPGYHLLTVILGRDVFTNETVERTPVNLIRGFMSLIPGGEQQFQQLNETGVIPQAAQRIETAMTELGISWEFVTNLFREIWDSVSLDDLLEPIATFERIAERFGEPISRLVAFVIEVVKVIIELVLILMNFPTELITSIITNVLAAVQDIKRDPVGFLINLLRTAKAGFQRFFDNFLTHLLAGLTSWLFRQLRDAGIEPPADLSLETILDFVLEVLGVTMDNIWSKLAERIGQDRVDQIRNAIDRLTGIWTFIQDVRERGVAAIWERIQSQISNLWDMLVNKVRDFVMERIVNRVVARLLSMLDPTGVMAVVNSFIAFFNAVQSAIEYLRDMLEIINDFVSTVAAIARGDVEPGAVRLEAGLANSLPVAIGFLANQVGLGRIGDKIVEVIQSIRQLIDRAINWLLDRAIALGSAVLNRFMGGGDSNQQWWETTRDEFDDTRNQSHEMYFREAGGRIELTVESVPRSIQAIRDILNGKQSEINENSNYTRAFGNFNRHYNTINRLMTNVTPTAGASASTMSQADMNQLTAAFNSLGDALEVLLPLIDGDTSNVPEAILPPKANDVRARPFEAQFISRDTRGNPSTSGSVPGQLLQLSTSGQTIAMGSLQPRWVKFHILNADIGGDGRHGSHLTPTTLTVNNNFKDEFETPLKNRVKNENKVVWYRFDIAFGNSPQGSTDEHRQNYTSLGTDYSPYPSFIKASYGYMVANNGTWEKDNTVVDEWSRNQQALGLPVLPGGRQQLQINTASQDVIANLTPSTISAGDAGILYREIRTPYSQQGGSVRRQSSGAPVTSISDIRSLLENRDRLLAIRAERELPRFKQETLNQILGEANRNRILAVLIDMLDKGDLVF